MSNINVKFSNQSLFTDDLDVNTVVFEMNNTIDPRVRSDKHLVIIDDLMLARYWIKRIPSQAPRGAFNDFKRILQTQPLLTIAISSLIFKDLVDTMIGVV